MVSVYILFAAFVVVCLFVYILGESVWKYGLKHKLPHYVQSLLWPSIIQVHRWKAQYLYLVP